MPFTIPYRPAGTDARSIAGILSNFDAILAIFNSALIEDVHLASPNNGVPRVVRSVSGAFPGSNTAGTYFPFQGSVSPASSASSYVVPIWLPDTSDLVVADKTTQFRTVTQYMKNTVFLTGITITVGLAPITPSGSGAGTLILTPGAQLSPAAIVEPGAIPEARVEGAWVDLSTLAAGAHAVTAIVSGGTTPATSTLALTTDIEIRHN